MMKWKVTRSPRCASADRSTDYLKKIEGFPDPPHIRSVLPNQQSEKEPLTENRKLAEQENELLRKPSFAATDCINLKGIFGISKERGEAAYSSLGLSNFGDRRRSRSEVRGISADRFSFAYHGNPIPVSQLRQQNSNTKEKNTDISNTKKLRSSSPTEKNKGWSRGRRRERETRKPSLNEKDVKKTTTENETVTSGKKLVNGKTNLDRGRAPSKQKEKKNERSISKDKSNISRGKENKELKDDNEKVKAENKSSNVLPQCPPSANKQKRISRKKGQAPKPTQAQIQKGNLKSSSVTEETLKSSCDETSINHVQLAADNPEILGSTFESNENMITNIVCNNDSPVNKSETEKKSEGNHEQIVDIQPTKMTIKAEVHFENGSIEKKLSNNVEKVVRFENDVFCLPNINCNDKLKIRTSFHPIRRNSTSQSINRKNDILPIIDEPDYTPSSSDDEEKDDIENKKSIDDEPLEKTETDKSMGPSTITNFRNDFVEINIAKDKEFFLTLSENEETRDQIEEPSIREQILINEIKEIFEEKISKKESEEIDLSTNQNAINSTETFTEPSVENTKVCNGISENLFIEECNGSADDVTDITELDDATLLDMSSDTLIGIPTKLEDHNPKSPSPSPSKKMASLIQQQLQQLMTVNVVVRNPPPENGTNISLTSPIINNNNINSEFLVKKKKSFVITVAKQEEGFRSLCASREFLSGNGHSEMGETDENQNRISVTFLCSGPPSENWINNKHSINNNNNRLRSTSVPPKNTVAQTEFVSLIAAAQRSGSKDRRTKDRQSSKRKSHRNRKKDTLFHMPQAVIDELSQVLETRKRVPDAGCC